MSSDCNISLTVLSPEATILETKVCKVSLPGTKGRFMILKGHAPIISSLDEGEVVFESVDGVGNVYIVSGFVEAASDKVTVCAEI